MKKYGISIDSNDNVTVEIWGSGKPQREFLWSEDMADACVFLMEQRNFSDTHSSSTKKSEIHISTLVLEKMLVLRN